MRLAVFALVVLAGCVGASEYDCQTSCGMWLVGDPGECSTIQAREDAALSAFARHVNGWDREATCGQLDHLLLSLSSSPAVISTANQKGAGFTYCTHGVIQLGSERAESVPHHLAHWFRCWLDGAWQDDSELTHSDWGGRGISAAIAEAIRP
jgi:hypothetical protein